MTNHRSDRIGRGGPRRALARAGVTALLALGATASTLALAGATPAGASTLDGIATIAAPGQTTALTTGGSDTPFTVVLPAQASCDADTATHGYHVYSYLVEKGTSLSGVTFVGFPSEGFGLIDNTGTYYGPVNTAIGTGQIVEIPNDFEWGPLVADDGVTLSQLLYTGTGKKASGAWEAGLACADSSGGLADYWNIPVTFAANSTDPNGFTWTAIPQLQVTTAAVSPSTVTIGTAYTSSALDGVRRCGALQVEGHCGRPAQGPEARRHDRGDQRDGQVGQTRPGHGTVPVHRHGHRPLQGHQGDGDGQSVADAGVLASRRSGARHRDGQNGEPHQKGRRLAPPLLPRPPGDRRNRWFSSSRVPRLQEGNLAARVDNVQLPRLVSP